MSDRLPVPRTVEWPGGAGKARRYAPRRGSGVIGTELPATRGIAIHDAIAHASQPSVRLPSNARLSAIADGAPATGLTSAN